MITIRQIAEAIYVARLKSAWGDNWRRKSLWPTDDKEWRAYPHNPAAEIDMALDCARAVLEALSDAECTVVPKEATDAEWGAAWETLQANSWLTLRQHISVHHARTFFQAVRHAMLAAAPEVT